MSLSGKSTETLLLTLVVYLAQYFILACLDVWRVEKLSQFRWRCSAWKLPKTRVLK